MQGQDTQQIRMQMKLQNDLMEKCFVECVNSYREEALTNNEKSCVGNCARRYLATFQQFAEIQQQMAQQQGQGGMF